MKNIWGPKENQLSPDKKPEKKEEPEFGFNDYNKNQQSSFHNPISTSMVAIKIY